MLRMWSFWGCKEVKINTMGYKDKYDDDKMLLTVVLKKEGVQSAPHSIFNLLRQMV